MCKVNAGLRRRLWQTDRPADRTGSASGVDENLVAFYGTELCVIKLPSLVFVVS